VRPLGYWRAYFAARGYLPPEDLSAEWTWDQLDDDDQRALTEEYRWLVTGQRPKRSKAA
jgi:hypothetical protein